MNTDAPTPTCLQCGYVLQGIMVDGKCPECGVPVWNSNREAPTSGYATASLVFGIISIPGCVAFGLVSLPTGLLAICFALLGFREARAGTRGSGTTGLATAGFATGTIGFLLGLVGLYLLLAGM